MTEAVLSLGYKPDTFLEAYPDGTCAGVARVAGPALGGALLGSRASGLPYALGCGLSLLAALVLVLSGTGRRPSHDVQSLP